MKARGQEARDREIARRISGGERSEDVARAFGIGTTWARMIATREKRVSGGLADADRLARIAAYEAGYIVRLEADVDRCRGALALAERRLARALEQRAAGELMTAALDPSVVRVLGLEPPFREVC